MKEEKAKTPPS